MGTRLLFFLLLLGGSLPARPLAAQQASAAEPPAEEKTPRFATSVDVKAEGPAQPPASTAATRVPVRSDELPLSVSVVPRRVVDERADLVLGDALESASGVNVGTGFGVFDFFVIRGFDSLSSGLVLTDGLPEPESTFYPLYNVEQVEVLKGPASFLHGANPLAGAVQLVRRQPRAARFADARLGYGRFGTFEAGLDANAATADAKLATRVNATWQGSDGYRELPDGSIKAVNPTLSWRPDERTRLRLDLEYVESGWPPDSGLPFVGARDPELADVPRTRSYQSPFDDSQQDLFRLRVEAERRVGARLLLRNRFYFTELEWLSDGTLIVGTFPGSDGRLLVGRTLVLLDDRQRLLGDQLELAANFETGGVAHELLVGVELRELKDRFTQGVGLLPPIDLVEPVETAAPPIVTIPPLGQAGDSRSLTLAPYLVDRLRLTDRLQALLGARLDALDYEDPPNATEREATRLNPFLGLSFAATRALALHASWGTATAPPSTQVVGPRDPEQSWQLELGGKLTFLEGKGFAGLSLYELRRENIAIPDAVGLTRQDGDQRSRGVELDLQASPAGGWTTRATYAFTDATLTRFAEVVPLLPPEFLVVDRSGNRAAFAPRHILGLSLAKRLDARLGASLGLRHVSEQFIAEDNRAAIEAYTTLDAALWYETPRLRLQLNARNLTDTEYETRGFGATSAIPARPFELAARVDVRFGGR